MTAITAALPAALRQTWPPFVLVAGLLLIGAVAASDGFFEAAGARLARLPGSGLALFVSLMLLTAVVTVVLNLDTSVVFLTPIVLHAARRRGIPELAFLYGVVFMSNSASLLLPGSNLTNLLVLLPEGVSGGVYASRMLAAWSVAVVVTMLVIIGWRRRDLLVHETGDIAADPWRVGLGVLGIIAATVLVLVFQNPAIPVLLAGVVVAAAQVTLTRRISLREALSSVSVRTITGLFLIAVLLGTIARVWGAPGHLMASVNSWESVALGAGAAGAVNNLPAAVLLSSRTPAHPLALLLGLDIGPNLVVWGALSAVLWMRVARREEARPSAVTYSKIGVILGPAAMIAALLALQAAGHA